VPIAHQIKNAKKLESARDDFTIRDRWMETNSPQITQVLRIMICGPGDIEQFAKVVLSQTDEWNRINGDALGHILRATHWKTDATPDLSQRGQSVINEQLHDHADIIVAILWNRFGTPTGIAESGTEEEIRRAIATGKRILLYFCLAEDTRLVDLKQADLVTRFRGEMMDKGLCWTFRSKREFQDLLREHLGRAIHQVTAAQPKTKPKADDRRKQSIRGDNNIQIGENHGTVQRFATPPRVVNQIARDPEWITPREKKQVQEWVNELADLTTNCNVGEARSSWWSRLGNKFEVSSYEQLRADQLPSVKAWYEFNKRELKKGRKQTDPEQWRKDETRKLKAAMSSMKRTKADYYPELARRLKIKPFISSKQLTKANLERVARMAYQDSRGG